MHSAALTPVLAIVGLVSLALAGNHLGPLSSDLGHAAAAVLAWAVACAALVPLGGRAFLRAAWIGVAAWVLVVHGATPAGPTFGVTLVLYLAAVAARAQRPSTHDLLLPAVHAGIVLGAYELCVGLMPSAWRAVDGWTRSVTGGLAAWSGAQTELGPSVAGVPLLLLLLAYLLSSARRAPAGRRGPPWVALAWTLGLAVLGWAAGVPLAIRIVLWVSRLFSGMDNGVPFANYPASVAVWLPATLFAACLIALVALMRVPVSGTPTGTRISRLGLPTLAFALSILALTILAGLPRIGFPSSADRPTVTLLDRGMVGWDVPTPAALGLERSGMFGMLPRYLEAAGYEVRKDADALRPDSLEQSDLLVVINPTVAFTSDELRRLQSFVERGGGLMVLGDHTDIQGSMQPLNELLAPYAIAFRFDSAFTPSHWHNNSGFLPGPMTRTLDDANSRFRQSTGASLTLGPGAAPVATARWGFSDEGDRKNKDNAFLGDYIYQPREPLGDLPVVAMALAGRGRVVVFGDTSAFQNVAIAFSWPFLDRVFQTAVGRNLPVVNVLAPLALLLWLVTVSIGLPARRGAIGAMLVATWLGLLLGSVVVRIAEPGPRAMEGPLAIIDGAHFNDVHLDLWDGDSIGGLAVNLARNGYLPLVDRGDMGHLLDSAELWVSVAPRAAIGGANLSRLFAFVERGGHAFLAVGWEEKAGSEPLLELAGFDLSPVPLGPVPILRKIEDSEIYRRLQYEPHFAEAWPISGVDPERDEILYASDGYPIVVRRSIGSGDFTLIADSKLLLNRTLEQEGAAWQGNVAFLRRLLRYDTARGPGL